MNLLRPSLLALLALAAWLVGAAPAAVAAPERIAVVDMIELISAHPRAERLQSDLDQREAEAEQFAREGQKGLRELQAEIELMNRNNPMRRMREKELLFQQETLKLELKWLEQEAMREYMEGLEALYAETQRLVARYARQQQIQVVLLKTDVEIKAVDFNDYGAKVRLRAVVYHEETLDITPQIKAMLEAQNPPAPAPGGGPGRAPSSVPGR